MSEWVKKESRTNFARASRAGGQIKRRLKAEGAPLGQFWDSQLVRLRDIK
jgi:hypothetical protein